VLSRVSSRLMNHRSPILRVLWLAAAVTLALLFVALVQEAHLGHLAFVTNATETNLASDAHSPTGYANGQRRTLIKENDPDSYSWLAQTQTFLAQKDWHIRRTNTENAPDGHAVTTSSPYRWWLALIAKIDHAFHPTPLGQNVETAVRIGNVWLVGLIVLAAFLTIRRWGWINAGWLAVGCTMLFPAGDFFSAGTAQNRGLAGLFALGAVLWFIPSPRDDETTPRTRFVLSGLASAAAIWIQPSWGLVLFVGIIGAEILSLIGLRIFSSRPIAPVPTRSAWCAWGLSGAGGILMAYLVDFAPRFFTAARLDVTTPFYALLFLAGGLVLSTLDRLLSSHLAKAQGSDLSPSPSKPILPIASAGVAVALCGFGLYHSFRGDQGLRWFDPLGQRFSISDGSGFADSFGGWLTHHDPSATVLAAIVPIFLVPLGFVVFAQRSGNSARRIAAGRASLTALLLGLWAIFHLRFFGLFEWMLIPVFFAIAEGAKESWLKRASVIGFGASCALGAFVMGRAATASNRTVVSRHEVQALVERDLAEWLTVQAGESGAIVLAAPDLSAALSHFGGLRNVTSPSPENQAGLAAATHILFATSQDEAQSSVQRRQITFVVLASWDSFFQDTAQRSGIRLENTLLGLFQGWRPPRWLRPLAYPMPQISGFENEHVTVFQVVDIQENAVALSHLAEYFSEVDQTNAAVAVSQALEKYFSDDLGAAVARIEVDAARGQLMAEPSAWSVVDAHLTDGSTDALPWDRRVALASVFAGAKRLGDAKTQLEACLHDADETMLRSLSPRALYRFQALIRALRVEEPPALREAALRRLPEDLRRNLEGRSGS